MTIKSMRSRKQVEDAFFRRYGRVISAWADIESVLAFWFCWTCNADVTNRYSLSQIFYSARSFTGSMDMLKSAFISQRRDPDVSKFFAEAAKITDAYYSFRNMLAHRLTLYIEPEQKMVLIESNDIFDMKNSPMEEQHLVIATRNFKHLNKTWLRALPDTNPKPQLTPLEALERVRALPTRAHSNELSQKQKGRLRQLAALRP